jgi:hypothetical protein
MAVPYTVMLPGGGSMTVNANSPEAARQNAGVNSSATVIAGGHQTISGSTTNAQGNVVGTTEINPKANVGAGELGRAPNSGGGSGSIAYGVAADGKSLSQQPVAVQNMFIAAYGPSSASMGWAIEHNTSLGVAPGAVPGSVSPNNNVQTTSPNPQAAKDAVTKSNAADTPAAAAAALTNYMVKTPDGGEISGSGSAPASLVKSVSDYYNALQTGNKAAADEAIKEFNQSYDLSVSSVSGTFNGSPTQAALKQAADIAYQAAGLTGTYNGAPTLAAEKQASDLAEQQFQQGISTGTLTGTYNGQQTLASQQMGLDALKAQAAMQNDPFRQQQYQYGLSAGGYSKAIDAMNGTTGFATSQGGMGPSAAGTNTLAYLGNQIAQYDPSHMGQFYANAMGQTGGAYAGQYQANGLQPPTAPASYSGAAPSTTGSPGLSAGNMPYVYNGRVQDEYLMPDGVTVGYRDLGPAPAGAANYTPSRAPMPATSTPTPANGSDGTQWLQASGGTSNTASNAYAMGGSLLGSGTATYNASLNALPNSANQIVGRNYLSADPATQNFITSGMSAKTGLDQPTLDWQIKQTMPKFNAPSFGLSTV